MAWIDFFLHWATIPIATICLFDGTRRLVMQRNGRTSIALCVAGAGLLLANAVVANSVAASLRTTIVVPSASAKAREMSPDVLARLPASERESKSRLLAAFNFTDSGVLTRYFTAEGTPILFAPTQAEVQEREKRHDTQTTARALVEQLQTKAYSLYIALLVAVLLGMVVAWPERRPK